jgi:hypothetical protein
MPPHRPLVEGAELLLLLLLLFLELLLLVLQQVLDQQGKLAGFQGALNFV